MGPGGMTVGYTTYMVGTLLGLLSLGHVSDHLGHARTLRVATVLALAGLPISGIAPVLPVLAIGRFAIGLATGIASTSTSAGLVAVSPPERMRYASSVGALMTIIGVGLGPLAGGLAVSVRVPLPHVLTHGRHITERRRQEGHIGSWQTVLRERGSPDG